MLGFWLHLFGLSVLCLAGLVLYTTLPPHVRLESHFGSLVDNYPTTRILRDSWGVPHVFAATDVEVAFGLAYAHAQDDFLNMQKAFLASRGRLASLEGKSGLVNDYLVHLLRLHERVESEYSQQLSPHIREVVSAYADGFNFFAYWHPTKIIAGDLFPISPQDVVSCFLHKIPFFSGLDEVVGKLLKEGPGKKSQQLMNLEATKSNMSEVLGGYWERVKRYLVSLFPELDVLMEEPDEDRTVSEPANAVPPFSRSNARLFEGNNKGEGPLQNGHPVQGEMLHSDSNNWDEAIGIIADHNEAEMTEKAPYKSDPSPQKRATKPPVIKDKAKHKSSTKGENEPQYIATNKFSSNAFAVSGTKTKDGSTLLAINAHQPWTGPFGLYEVHLHSKEGWNFVGGVFPGCPIPLSGHNRHLGWAHTVNTPDTVDVYELTMGKDCHLCYLFDGRWYTLERKSVFIAVKIFGRWNSEIRRELLWSPSHNAPVIQNSHGTYAIRYSGSDRINQLDQLMEMTKASDFQQWYTGVSRQTMPVFSVVYADKQGNVFYGYNALLPQNRSTDYDWSIPVPGNITDTLWTEDYVPWDHLPQVFNPSSGFVQNCHSSPFRVTLGQDNPSPLNFSLVGIERHMTNRALRALELLGEALECENELDLQKFVRIKFDVSYSQNSLMAYLLNNSLGAYEKQLDAMGAGKIKGNQPLLVRAMALLRKWDLSMSSHSIIAPLAYFAFRPYMEGPVAQRYYTACGDGSPDKLKWPSLLHLGLSEDHLLKDIENAAIHLKRAHGRVDPEWGMVQRLVRGKFEWDLNGGPDVLRTIHGSPDIKKCRLTADSGDGYLQIVRWDINGKVHSKALQPYGTSNYAKSPHFQDQSPLFAEQRMRDVLMEEHLLSGAQLEEVYHPGRERDLDRRAIGPLGEIGAQKRKQARAKQSQ